MKLIQSLMGRRQFMIAAAMTSTLGWVSKKLARVVDPGFQTGVAMASGMPASEVRVSEQPGTAGMKGASNRYTHLLSPLKIRNVVLKNRMSYNNALPHFLQGPENFPSDVIRSHYTNISKNGAAVVTCMMQNEPAVYGNVANPRKERTGDMAHFVMYDFDDYGVQNYVSQLAEGIKCYGAKASFAWKVSEPPGYKGSGIPIGEEISPEIIKEVIEEAVTQAKFFKTQGFDMISLPDTLSPAMRNRTDKYGGSTKNRTRFAIELYEAIKKACGQDFLIEAVVCVQDPSSIRQETMRFGRQIMAPDYTLEEMIAIAKLWEGLVDILQIRVSGGMANHPSGYNSEKVKPLTLRLAQAIKESGVKIMTSPNGGFQDLDLNEEFIASGKCDMIAMGRAFFCDLEYGEKAYEGRGEDVVPCVRCNKCHGLSALQQWVPVCSVNPKLGISTAVRLIGSPPSLKKVAVIGGGPAGMKAAITAAERGHKVILYEKNDFLGGKLRHADFDSFKWPLKDFKDYLIRQVNKAGIELLLSTEATPEMIKAKGYDVVLVAIGAEPIIPKIPGTEDKNLWNIVDVYGKEKALGKNVVIVGGGEFGLQTGGYLAKSGHKVTLLTSEKELVQRTGPHQAEIMVDAITHLNNFSYFTETTTTRISEEKLTYVDAKGSEKSIQADSVVVYAGLKPRKEEALKFYGSARQWFFTIGDCSDRGGNVQKSIRSAFFAASQI